MAGETASGMGFRAQIRELLSHESTVLVPVTEKNLPRFEATLTFLDKQSKADDGMLNISLGPTESNAEWVRGVKAMWVFGPKEANLATPEQATGFVNVYAPEHMDEINDMLKASKRRPFDSGAVVEFASYAKEFPNHLDAEESAVKQALTHVFMDEQFKDVRAVSVWVTHEQGNVLDPRQEAALKKIGAIKFGSLRYAPVEQVDSTCFLINRKMFLDKLMPTTKIR